MCKKELLLQVRKTPADEGYGDTIVMFVDKHLRFAYDSRGGPNWRAPRWKGGGPWHQHYGWLAEGIYSWRWRWSWKHGAHLSLNNCGVVASRTPNPRHGGQHIMKYVLIHGGQSATWPGSAGCITIPPVHWESFIANFSKGDSGTIEVRDYDGGKLCPLCRSVR